MTWIDYREKLGLSFSDEDKYRHFLVKIFNFLENIRGTSSQIEYFEFCNMTGTKLKSTTDLDICRYNEIKDVLKNRASNLCAFLSYYIAFVNVTKRSSTKKYDKEFFITLLKDMLSESKINFDIIEDEDSCFVFPKGAKELDDALVSEPLDWLQEYPVSHKAFTKALKDYANATESNASDIADSFRKVFENFCREFLGNDKNLKSNKTEICSFLENKGVPKEIRSNFESILNLYYSYNNGYAKHRDATSDKLLEFIMYQTGNFIRLMITMK